jgi:hypothetical protein
MYRLAPRLCARLVGLFMVLAAAVLAIAGCSVPGAPPTNPTPPLQGQQQINLDAPRPGASVASPALLRGSTSQFPFEGNLIYRVFDVRGDQIGSGPFQVNGAPGQAATFETQAIFNIAASGPGRIEVVDLDAADGSVRGIASVSVALQTSSGAVATSAPATAAPLPPTAGPTPTEALFPPESVLPGQQIFIDTPPPGTVVGSPVVLTGRTTLLPPGGQLTYRVLDASGRQIGAGAFNASPAGQEASFSASLLFQEPAGGGLIRAELMAPTTNGSTSASLDLYVAPPQQIFVDTPPPGTIVGSPVVLTGRLARLPFDSNLAYRIQDGQGRQIGAGLIPVSGVPGQPTFFNASLTFDAPLNGGAIRVDLTDERAADGLVVARASIDLRVAPAQQAIFIDTPPPGTIVGSPVVLTGRSVRYPFDGNLAYQFFDAGGVQIGVGAFNVQGAPGQSATFSAQLFFNLPRGGGPIQVNLYDQNGATGAIVASAAISLQVAAPQPEQQVITIETPPTGTLVGSPVVVTGRTTRYPFEGNLGYRVRDQTGREIGSGGFRVNGAPGQPATFVGSLMFSLPPSGGVIRLEIFDVDQSSGAILAIAAVDLEVTAPLPPIVRPRSGG